MLEYLKSLLSGTNISSDNKPCFRDGDFVYLFRSAPSKDQRFMWSVVQKYNSPHFPDIVPVGRYHGDYVWKMPYYAPLSKDFYFLLKLDSMEFDPDVFIDELYNYPSLYEAFKILWRHSRKWKNPSLDLHIHNIRMHGDVPILCDPIHFFT